MGASRTQRAWEGEKSKGRLWKLFWAIDYDNRNVILLAKIIYRENKIQHSCIMPASFSSSELQIIKNKIKKIKEPWIFVYLKNLSSGCK